MKAVLLLSGGMDSVTLLYDKKPTHALTFVYGSKHNEREIGFAEHHCRELGVNHEIIDLGFVGELFKSDLLVSGGEIPEGHYHEGSMKQTVVPFRNGIMLAIAVGYAESNNLEGVLIANHAGDHAIYPDCRPDFINAMREVIEKGTYAGIKLFSPYVGVDKRVVALRGKELGVDFSRTYTCYKGGEKHCGKCGACVERKEALAGFDNTEYLE